MVDNERDFKGVWIPKAVWLDERLTALDKVIFTEIDSLDQGERGCYASNQYIADFCQCSATKVSKSISKLIDYGYLYVQNFDGRQRELKSRLTQMANEPCKKDKADMKKKQQSNTANKPVNNPDKKKERKKESSYDVIISEYTTNEDLRTAIYDFIKMRNLIKSPMTDRALKNILSKLNDLAKTDDRKIKILEQSIERSWKGVFPLKDEPVRKDNNDDEYGDPEDFYK